MATEMPKCEDKVCNNGSTYWAVTQMCSQDKLWTIDPPRQPIAEPDKPMCYCMCVLGQRYCFNPDCVTNITAVINACTADQVKYQDFVTMKGDDGKGSTDCNCPCPHIMCTFCDSDPDIKEYVKENCKEFSWWPGYPMVLSMGGGQLCTCLCPDDAAKAMTVTSADNVRVPLHTAEPGTLIMAAGPDLDWQPTAVRGATSLSRLTPIVGVKLLAGDNQITLAPDQLLLNADRRLQRAITLRPGDSLMTPAGDLQVVTEAEHLPIYSFPLRFLALALDEPGQGLSGRLMDINGFVVGDYSTQIFNLLGRLDETHLVASTEFR